MPSRRLRTAIAGVVESGNCSGCGACALMHPSVSLQRSPDGFNRPVVAADTEDAAGEQRAVREFTKACPGSLVAARRPPGTRRDAIFGSYLSVWEAWAADDQTRFVGSSGGALTALTAWLVESGRVVRAVTAQADPVAPGATVTKTVAGAEDILAGAGSRYGPVSTLTNPDVLAPDTAVVAKPCEATALTTLVEQRQLERPIVLSFFCAGVPSQHATDDLVRQLGVADDELAKLTYRGRGWPGRFTATRLDGTAASMTYDESWGAVLGRELQWRCKICPDGVGESSDVTAGDFWRSDERGYPVFTEGGGQSVLIARTPRGHELLEEAIAAGVIEARHAQVEALHPVQPLQVARRAELAARTLGVRMAGRPVPRYRGFRLWALSARRPIRALRSGIGAFRRARRGDQ